MLRRVWRGSRCRVEASGLRRRGGRGVSGDIFTRVGGDWAGDVGGCVLGRFAYRCLEMQAFAR